MTPATARAMYARQFAGVAQVTLRRIVPNASPVDVAVRAKVTGYAPNELMGGIQQGDSRAIVLAVDVEATAFPGPIKAGDKLVIGGRVRNIQFLDDQTRRIGDTLIAYDLTLRG